MANPSSSRHDLDDRDRDRERRHRSDRERRSSSSSSHHHRTISSTTLLLVLSLILAVLAVMLSLPNSAATTAPIIPVGVGKEPEDTSAKQQQESHWGILTPKRSQALVARESSVASREAEVARREAEMLVGAPGGVIPPTQTVCPVCVPEPAQTVIKEVVPESAVAPPSWYKESNARAEETLDRELKIAEREREISKREESVNRREHDASRRESWIMEQLISLGNDHPPQSVHEAVEEEYIAYEQPKRKLKPAPKYIPEQAPKYIPEYIPEHVPEYIPEYITEYIPEIPQVPHEIEYMTVTETLPPHTVTLPPPANTRLAAFPRPDGRGQAQSATTVHSPRTTVVDVLVEETTTPTVAFQDRRPPPAKWFGGW